MYQKAHRCTSARQNRNCKMDDVCTNLDHLFLCDNGLCRNITDVFDCRPYGERPVGVRLTFLTAP